MELVTRRSCMDGTRRAHVYAQNVPLAPYTTLRIGGPARYFFSVTNDTELREAVLYAHTQQVPFVVLGGGSNTLFADGEYEGVVIHMCMKGVVYEERDDTTVLCICAGGEVWDDVVADTVTRGLSGLENLSGIPGSVGASPVQNIGAYGVEVGDHIEYVEVFDTRTFKKKKLSREECCFGYRDSIFKSHEGRAYIVTRVAFRLLYRPHGNVGTIYKDNRFNIGDLIRRRTETPTLKDVRDVIIEVRDKKGMCIKKDGTSFASAGSFFGNPIVSRAKFEYILKVAEYTDKEKESRLRPWFWDQSDGSIKVAAAFLLEFTTFLKGYTRGRVGVSPYHSLSLINLGNATAREISDLARDMQDAVEKLFNVRLVSEVEHVGTF
ncbi:UDP-N-acetylmuramate dehydrogenase [Candidatus Campbellbacteria bacterium]|nr:MAG: UDP-N-acetylmuramate dehydrogenase [Candidatus Campbellbacteria bacterium]